MCKMVGVQEEMRSYSFVFVGVLASGLKAEGRPAVE